MIRYRGTLPTILVTLESYGITVGNETRVVRDALKALAAMGIRTNRAMAAPPVFVRHLTRQIVANLTEAGMLTLAGFNVSGGGGTTNGGDGTVGWGWRGPSGGGPVEDGGDNDGQRTRQVNLGGFTDDGMGGPSGSLLSGSFGSGPNEGDYGDGSGSFGTGISGFSSRGRLGRGAPNEDDGDGDGGTDGGTSGGTSGDQQKPAPTGGGGDGGDTGKAATIAVGIAACGALGFTLGGEIGLVAGVVAGAVLFNWLNSRFPDPDGDGSGGGGPNSNPNWEKPDPEGSGGGSPHSLGFGPEPWSFG